MVPPLLLLAAMVQPARGACSGVLPASGSAVTVWPCSTDGLGASSEWLVPTAGTGGQGRVALRADPSLCLDIQCGMTPCIGGPGPHGLVWWGADTVVSDCSAAGRFRFHANGTVSVSKPGGSVPAGLCLEAPPSAAHGGRSVQASPCSGSSSQQWAIGVNGTLVAAGGPSDGFCATGCAEPPVDSRSFCPRLHRIHDAGVGFGGVADPCGPLLDGDGLWHVWDDTGGWSHWTSSDLVHWQGSLESSTNFSGATGSVSPTPGGVFAHWPIIAGGADDSEVGAMNCCAEIGSAKAADGALTQWEQRGPTISRPARATSGFRDPARAFQWHGKWFVGVGCGDDTNGAQFCLFEASDETLSNFTDRGSLFTTNTTLGFMGAGNVWQETNVTATMLECPDLFPIGGAGTNRWILIASLYNQPNFEYTNQWFVGTLSGDPPRFTAEHTGLLDYGSSYAAKSGSTMVQGPASRRLLFRSEKRHRYMYLIEFRIENAPIYLLARQTPGCIGNLNV
jgi:hypothetical protein